ncbi:MAG: D-alanyl-D-alanine carboxypeptidase/D-alanyl-D-alanine-endopeptidase [Marinifilaceae bacterium]|nr:D-alanyl-D-alanine carboxypeptidase/D-alanyl-D-alanine-endopeptidase [Marinifilaceae bacterium]
MRRILLIFIAILLSGVLNAQPAEALHKFLSDTLLQWATIGVDIRCADSGEPIVEHNSHTALIPASLTKLISTAFALEVCGPQYRVQTEVYTMGNIEKGFLNGPLKIYSYGDPTLDSKYFPERKFLRSIVSLLNSHGIKGVSDVEFIPMLPCDGRYNGTWLSEDIANYYGANSMPFNWSDNSCRITLRSDSEKAYFLSETPTAMNFYYNNLIKVVPGAKSDIWIYGGATGYREIRGVMDANLSSYSVNSSMGFPEEYFKSEFYRYISPVAESVNKPNERGEVLLISYNSPSFAEIVSVANKRSVNLYVEALARIAANKIDGGECYNEKIVDWLSGIVSDGRGVVLKDACGLAPMNRVPATVFTELLLWGKGRWNGTYEKSLAISGGTGTLKNFTKEYPYLNGNIVAKSGSMSGVRSLAGYIKARSGKRYVFTIMANGFVCSGSDVMKLFASFLNDIYLSL